MSRCVHYHFPPKSHIVVFLIIGDVLSDCFLFLQGIQIVLFISCFLQQITWFFKSNNRSIVTFEESFCPLMYNEEQIKATICRHMKQNEGNLRCAKGPKTIQHALEHLHVNFYTSDLSKEELSVTKDKRAAKLLVKINCRIPNEQQFIT